MTKPDANHIAAAAMQESKPVIMNVSSAGKVIPELENMTLLHAGPPIEWKDMLEIQRGAVIGAVLYEGWASTPEHAIKMAEDGSLHLIPCNDVNAVGGLAGITSPSMPVVVAASSDGRHKAFSRLWDPFLVFGYFDSRAIQMLQWIEKVMAPGLKICIEHIAPIEMSPIVASALQMGDDTHSRKDAMSLLLMKSLLSGLIRSSEKINNLDDVLGFWMKYDSAALSFLIAAAKVMSLAASSIKGSSVITVICTNGVETGLKLSGTGDHWFTGPAPVITGKLKNGFTEKDASPGVGDSAIAEVVGLGGAALAAAPKAPANYRGGLENAVKTSLQAQRIAVTQHKEWRIPALGDMGTALGLDARKSVELSILPPLASTIPNIHGANPPVGAGMAKLDMNLLRLAVEYLDKKELM